MCKPKRPKMPKMPAAQQMLIPASTNAEALREADIEASLRRRRAGAAANILTSALGIPSPAAAGRLGEVGQ
jgi:hypothetical protein